MPTPDVAVPFKGTLYDPNTGAGVSGVRVRILPVNSESPTVYGAFVAELAATGADGKWNLSVTANSPTGRYDTELFYSSTTQTRYILSDISYQMNQIVGYIDANGNLVAPLPAASVMTSHIKDWTASEGSGITTAKIADLGVTTAKIAAGAVTAEKVAADVATQAELDAHTHTATSGTYLGDGAVGRFISVGFTPRLVQVFEAAGTDSYHFTLIYTGTTARTWVHGSAGANAAHNHEFSAMAAIVTNGFNVKIVGSPDDRRNANFTGFDYFWIAYR